MTALSKKCAICFYLFCVRLPVFASASAQELNTTAVLGGLPISIGLESRDAGCSKRKQIQVNRMFCMVVTLNAGKQSSNKDLTLKSFDAAMPGHGHGMVTRAKIKALKDGEYLIEGLKLHMPGEWSFKVDVLHGNESAQVAIPLKL